MSTDITPSDLQKHHLQTEDIILNEFKKKHQVAMRAFEKTMRCIQEIENELDQENANHKTEEGRRKKSHSSKSFDFQGVPHKIAIEDLDEIYDGVRENEKFGPGKFKRNDTVLCIADRKKYKGTIISTNQKGMIVRTKDRRKIRISWDEIEDEEVKVSKVYSDDE